MSWAKQQSFVMAKTTTYLNGKLKGSSCKTKCKPLPDDCADNATEAAKRRMALARYRLSDVLAALLP